MLNLQSVPNDIARIDIERVGNTTIFVRVWKKGYNTRDAGAPDFEDMLNGGATSMSQLCAALEAQGFSITMSGSVKARCLRAAVTRIDFVYEVDGWHIKKYPDGWRASTRPMSDVIKTEEEINAAVAWCEEKEWSIRRGEKVIRAWKGEILPVHNARTIRKLRSMSDEKVRRHDYAYDG